MISFIIRWLLRPETPRPLGRWHNVGERFHADRIEQKERQKYIRYIYKKYNIDPYGVPMHRVNHFGSHITGGAMISQRDDGVTSLD